MDDKTIKPCPFCGEVPDVSNHAHFQHTGGYKYGALVCGCGAQAPEVRADYKEVSHWKAVAIDAWNDRAAQPSVQVPQWISVSDEMPEDRQDVLFVVDCKGPKYDHLHGRVLGGKYIGGQHGYFSIPGMGVAASYWMPSPPPPAAPQGDEK